VRFVAIPAETSLSIVQEWRFAISWIAVLVSFVLTGPVKKKSRFSSCAAPQVSMFFRPFLPTAQRQNPGLLIVKNWTDLSSSFLEFF